MPRVLPPRWGQYLARLFDRRHGSPVQLLDDVLPVAPITDPGALEQNVRRGEVPWYLALGVAAPGPALYSELLVGGRNPDFLTVIDGVCISPVATGGWFPSLGLTNMGGTTQALRRDLRGQFSVANARPPSAGYVEQSTGVGPTGNMPLIGTLNFPATFPLAFVCNSTSFLRLTYNQVNQGYGIFVWGRDIPIDNQADAGA